MHKYAKHLGIGLQWTKEELEESQFHGAILEGFGKSAWPMYEIAKQRVEYVGWDLFIDGEELDGYDESCGFEFRGMRHLSIQTCIEYYVKAMSLDSGLLESLVEIVGADRFTYALRIAELNRDISHLQRLAILEEIKSQEQDNHELNEIREQEKLSGLLPLVAVVMDETTAEPEAIEWAINHACHSLELLLEQEDDFFDAFEHLGGPTAFALFDGLQWYLAARRDSNWCEENDPNNEFWQDIESN